MLEYYTYAWVDPTTRIPFYIGKGKNNRYKAPRKTRAGYKLTKLLERGHNLEDIVCIINFYTTEQEAYADEQRIIAWHKRHEDGTLLNITEGGDGFTSNGATLAMKLYHRNKTAQQINDFQIANSKAHKGTVWLNDGNKNIKTKIPETYLNQGYKMGMISKNFDNETLCRFSKRHKGSCWINNGKKNKKVKDVDTFLDIGWSLGMLKQII